MTGAEIIIRLHDVTAREDSSPACAGAAGFAGAANLREDGKRQQPDRATLEKDFFRLDGSFEPFPSDPKECFWGLWSGGMSGGDCVFAPPPVLRIGFTRSHSSVGLTLRFYEREQDYCKHLRVRWLDADGNIMFAKEFFPRDAAPFLSQKVEGYYGLELTFLESAKPWRYLKLSGIDYGMELSLTGKELSSATILEEVDPTGSAVSINTLDMTVHSPSAEFSPLNPAGYFSVFQQNQKLLASAVTDGAKREMGSFFLRSWEADAKNNVKLHAVDAAGIMDKANCYGGVYRDTPVREVLNGIFAAAGAALELDESLEGKKLNGYLKSCTARQALGQIALAIGGVVDCSRGEAVKLYPMPRRPSALIDTSRKFSGQRIKLRPDITGIDITTHTLTARDERYTAFDGTLSPGGYTILFAEPTHSPVITGASIAEAGANYLRIIVGSPGRVMVTGGRYLHSKQALSDNMAQQAANLAENRLKVEDATLASAENAGEILSRLRDCCKRGLESEFSVKLGDERVADMVIVRSAGGESIRGVIESMEIDLTGGCIAKLKITAERIETLYSSYTGELYCGQSLGVM